VAVILKYCSSVLVMISWGHHQGYSKEVIP